MHLQQIVALLMDYYMGPYSPERKEQGTAESRVVIGDDVSSPELTHMLAALSVAVRSLRLPSSNVCILFSQT